MEPIRVNGDQHDITYNLHTQLCRVRALGYDGLLWNDALCIDQLNKSERSAQVAMMDRIFRAADEVFIGLDDDVRSLSEAAADHAVISTTVKELASGVHLRDLRYFYNSKMNGTAGLSVARLLRRFLCSAWFQRVWCVQEICLARKATLILASGFLSWKTFTLAFEQWHKHRRGRCCSDFFETLDVQLTAKFHQV